MRRWDRLQDAYLDRYRAQGLSEQAVLRTAARLERWGVGSMTAFRLRKDARRDQSGRFELWPDDHRRTSQSQRIQIFFIAIAIASIGVLALLGVVLDDRPVSNRPNGVAFVCFGLLMIVLGGIVGWDSLLFLV